eukprot:scaffold130930_cov63-Phaeocystis_antarctica.AAC.4
MPPLVITSHAPSTPALRKRRLGARRVLHGAAVPLQARQKPAGKFSTCAISDMGWPLKVKSILSFTRSGFWPCSELASLNCCVTAPELMGGSVSLEAGLICSFMNFGTATCPEQSPR